MMAHPDSGVNAAITLAVTVSGSVMALFTAEVLSHLITHEQWMSKGELKIMAASSAASLTVITLPVLVLVGAALNFWSVHTALRINVLLALLTLIVSGLLATKNLQLSMLERIAVLLAEAVLGGIVIVLELLAHY